MSRLYPSGQAGPTVSAGATLPEGSRPLLVIGIVDVGLTSTPAGMANRLADVQAFSRTQASNSAAEETELLMHADDEHGVAYIVLSAATGLLNSASSIINAEGDATAHAWLTDRTSERALTVLFLSLIHI